MTIRLVFALLAMLALEAPAQPVAADLSKCSPDGIATGGYDLVSYWSVGGPVRGTAAFALEFAGLTYLFASAANRDAFRRAPQDFLPAYGGWCATTTAHGALRCPDFSNFKIEDGRLLFFEITGFTNGRVVWDTDPVAYRMRADENFRLLTGR